MLHPAYVTGNTYIARLIRANAYHVLHSMVSSALSIICYCCDMKCCQVSVIVMTVVAASICTVFFGCDHYCIALLNSSGHTLTAVWWG